MFRLTDQEKQEVVAICDHLKQLKFSPHLPYVFTEHGAVMLASILNKIRKIKPTGSLSGLKDIRMKNKCSEKIRVPVTSSENAKMRGSEINIYKKTIISRDKSYFVSR